MPTAHHTGTVYRISIVGQDLSRIRAFPCLLTGEITPEWHLKQPVSLKIERDEDGSFIMSEEVFNIYGHGATPENAKEDFIIALVEYYEILKKYASVDDASKAMLDKFKRLWLPPA